MMTMSGPTCSPNGYLILMQVRHYKYIVLGGGISGLTLALELQSRGREVLVLEKSSRAGGVLQSAKQGGFVWDRAAHTIAVDRDVKTFLDKYHLSNFLIKASDVSKVRQIAIKDQIWEISNHPAKVLGGQFLSFKAKVKLLKELFKRPIKDANPTVYEFFEYHFGSEITKNIISAVFSGIYAGNIEQMEMKSVMAKVFEIEQESGSIIRGMIKNKDKFASREIFGFRGGMEVLGEQLSEQLDHINYNSEVDQIKRKDERFVLSAGSEEFTCDQLISTLPSYALAPLMAEVSKSMQKKLLAISYQPMVLIHVGFPKLANQENTKAFGFLCSQYDSPTLKGALYNSDLFESRAPKDFNGYTIFMKPKIKCFEDEDKMTGEISKTVERFKKLTGITVEPHILMKSVWRNAIPQFNRPFSALRSSLLEESSKLDGFTLSGSFISGVSVPDCIKHNIKVASEL